MSAKISFIDLSRKILFEVKKPMTPEDIWEYAKGKGYDQLVGSKGKTPWKTIQAQLYVHIRDNRDSPFRKTDSTPRKFYLRELESESLLSEALESEDNLEEKTETSSFHERDLHPFLTYFAANFMNVYTKTILHEKSNKKTYSQWLHPDLVGVNNLDIDDWHSDVLDFGMVLGGQLVKIYSFEMKKELTFSNLREAFFQAVSNSSWANEGYLVAAKISKDEEFLTELKRLSTSFSIGIIHLDIADPDASEIIFPARFKNNLDWDTINKLANQNPDFSYFLRRVKNDLTNKEFIKNLYDKVYELEKLVGQIKNT